MRNTSNVWLSIFVALSGLLCACSCDTGNKIEVPAPQNKTAVPEGNQNGNENGNENQNGNTGEEQQNAADAPVMGKVTTYKLDGVEELSGMCLSKDKDFMWGIGDQGKLYKINFNGTYEFVRELGGDLEGLTMDPATGNMYVAMEGDQRVAILKAPDYTKLSKLFDVTEAADYGNSGLEGIAWYKGELYVGAQTGANIWRFSLTGTKLDGKRTLRNVTSTISEVGDMCYDPVSDRLWVVDSNSNKDKPQYLPFQLYVFNGEATKLIGHYPLSGFTTNNPEVVCVDRDHNCVWIADDSSKSVLHKVEFTNL